MQKNKNKINFLLTLALTAFCLFANNLRLTAQQNDGIRSAGQQFVVKNGVLQEVKPEQLVDSLFEVVADSLPELADAEDQISTDSLATDSLVVEGDLIVDFDTVGAGLTAKELRQLARRDTTVVRYSSIFRDSIPLSRMCWISMGVPGFGQLYNQQYWKIPIAYATLGASITGAVIQNKHYKTYKTQYDAMMLRNASRSELDPVQTQMIKYNTSRQLMFAAVAASYIYFICDGAVNYPGTTSNVKKATTLSTILPGAGQFYNKSYWKVPIVIGGFASLAYVIDFNSRGYNRFKLAYDLLTDGDDSTVDEFGGAYSSDFLSNYKTSYRRNRDLAIIITAGFYILNIIDAYVDAQFKQYDISDDLAMDILPMMTNLYTVQTGSTNMYGMSLNFKF